MYLHQSTDIPFTNEQIYHPMSLLIEWGQQFSRSYQARYSGADQILHCLAQDSRSWAYGRCPSP